MKLLNNLERKYLFGRRDELLSFVLRNFRPSSNVSIHSKSTGYHSWYLPPMVVHQAVLLIIWRPESVSTMSESWPTSRSKEASSNGFCIAPRVKNPRSPPRLADEQSEYFSANSSSLPSPDSISFRYLDTRSRASSFVRSIFSSLHDDGLLQHCFQCIKWCPMF